MVTRGDNNSSQEVANLIGKTVLDAVDNGEAEHQIEFLQLLNYANGVNAVVKYSRMLAENENGCTFESEDQPIRERNNCKR